MDIDTVAYFDSMLLKNVRLHKEQRSLGPSATERLEKSESIDSQTHIVGFGLSMGFVNNNKNSCAVSAALSFSI